MEAKTTRTLDRSQIDLIVRATLWVLYLLLFDIGHVAFHELCHLLAAKAFNLPVKEVSLISAGFLLTGGHVLLKEPPFVSGFTAIMGPIGSVIFAIFGYLLFSESGNKLCKPLRYHPLIVVLWTYGRGGFDSDLVDAGLEIFTAFSLRFLAGFLAFVLIYLSIKEFEEKSASFY